MDYTGTYGNFDTIHVENHLQKKGIVANQWKNGKLLWHMSVYQTGWCNLTLGYKLAFRLDNDSDLESLTLAILAITFNWLWLLFGCLIIAIT